MPDRFPIDVGHFDQLLEQLEWSHDLIEQILDRVAPEWRPNFPEMVTLLQRQRRGISALRATLEAYRSES